MPESCTTGGTWGGGGWGVKLCFQKFNQIWCVSYLHEWHMHHTIFWVIAPWGLGRGPKGELSLNLNNKVNFKYFNFVYLLTNERYITYQTGFLFGHLGHAQGWDLGVRWGVKGQIFFSEIQPDLVCELLTWMAHAQFFGSSPPGALGGVKNLIFWTWSCSISN